MNNQKTINRTDWEIPIFTTSELSPKKTKYCICIPVINEGERIQNQLRKMKNTKISDVIDIIICDGGSSDHSVEPGFLKDVKVRTLLTKRDEGIVGAQLRMGYAYALQEGYEGVITMDGNDKDGIDVVFKFIEKLEEGFDYIQGSRYTSGGFEMNTPLIRKFAIKYIHVPIINLLSGFKYTDTTNGNRGYSRRLLLSEKIKPFRKIFYHYEFLVFVSSKAHRLGFKTTEVPMTRKYPKGKVPTKISFFKGNFSILKSLFLASLNKYSPK